MQRSLIVVLILYLYPPPPFLSLATFIALGHMWGIPIGAKLEHALLVTILGLGLPLLGLPISLDPNWLA